MKETIKLPFCTEFMYDKDTSSLTLTSLLGMSCAFGGHDRDYSDSGAAVICADSMRLEGKKLKYRVSEVKNDSFCFDITDENSRIKLECRWIFDTAHKVISCNYTLVNTGDQTLTVRRALPRWVFSPGRYRLHYQESRWLAESLPRCTELNGADINLHARAARSSCGNTPFCILEDMENSAAAAFHVVPRGNWTIQIHSRILSCEAAMPVIEAGLSDSDLFFPLGEGERLELPEVIITEVPKCDPGLAGALIQKYFINNRLPENLNTPPVVYNSWLYRFTNFTAPQLREQLSAAKKIGCEVFIVDAGWFGGDDWYESVGDWQEKPQEPFFGNMASFADEVRASGLDFGFWMEPERWAEKASIRKEHPEWFPDHSFRIDLDQPEAAEHFIGSIRKNIKKFNAKYIKLDFNSDMGYDESGRELHSYCTKLTELLKQLRSEFPELIIENCGSGSLRSDLATSMLYDVAFVSDHAHLFENLRIRQGLFARTIPGRTLNWAVTRPAPERRTKVYDHELVLGCTSASWDEGALFDVDFIMSSALLGVPGFSGDLAGLAPEILDRYAEYIAFYKENREFFVNSLVYQLNFNYIPEDDCGNILAFQMQGGGSSDSLVFAYSSGFSRRDRRRFKLHALIPDKTYRVTRLFAKEEETSTASGADLMQYGADCSFIPSNFVRHSGTIYKITEL